ncbi:ACT domain-containing protein, partial [Mesorhizobium sp. M1380]|uniref:ACT domain-containing protein n=1 Tax=Mesorhizobium sp. M1380 TaxID=2957093 RepID=UPI0033352148
MKQYVLKVSCPAARGIVAAISGLLAAEGCNIIDSSQFDDVDTGKFFMRVSFISEEGAGRQVIEKGFQPIADKFGMSWELHDGVHRMKVLRMTSTTLISTFSIPVAFLCSAQVSPFLR